MAPFHSSKIATCLRAALPDALLIAIVFLSYASAFSGTFLLDDRLLILNNPNLRDWHHLKDILMDPIYPGSAFWRPVQMFVYLLIYQMAGPSPVAFHFLNVGLHALNACLIYRLGLKLDFNHLFVWLAAGLWALHPIQTEAISYISGTADPLAVAFCLWGLLVLLPSFEWRRFLMALPLFALALGSKESAVVFPMLVLVTILLKQRQNIHACVRTECLWILDAVYLLARFHGEAASRAKTVYSVPDFVKLHHFADNIWIRSMTALATIPDYLELLLYPAALHPERSFPVYASLWSPQILLGCCIVFLALLLIIRGWRATTSPFGWGILWFGSAFSIYSGIPVALEYIVAEHWMYLPTIGLCLGGAEATFNMLKSPGLRILRRPVPILFVIVILLSGFATWHQNLVWQNTLTLFTHTLQEDKSTSAAHLILGNTYFDLGQYSLAIAQYRQSEDMRGDLPIVHANLATALLKRKSAGDIGEARRENDLAIILSRDPVYAGVRDQAIRNAEIIRQLSEP